MIIHLERIPFVIFLNLSIIVIMKESIKTRIQDELLKRRLINSSYSLRALARDLEINHSLLSRIISSKIQMTPKIFDRISGPLKLSTEEMSFYKNEITERKLLQSEEKVAPSSFRQLTSEEFKAIQDWYNFAILELVNLDDFVATEAWISKKLNISENEAKMALERLLAMNLLSKSSKGVYAKVSGQLTVMTPSYTSAPMKNRQKIILLKAIEALETLPIEKRDNSSLTLCIDSALLPEIKEKIKKMRRSLANYIVQKSKNKDHVYELSIAFFPWTHDDDSNA